MRNAKLMLAILSLALIPSCAWYSGYGLKAGSATAEDVVRVMGQPAKRWQNPDHSLQLAYLRGLHTYMVFIAPDNTLQHIENVMDPKVFTRIRPGMTEEEVLRTLGPPAPGGTVYYRRRDELALEWRYCDDWDETALFDVLFDNTKRTVRSTLTMPECPRGRCLCSR